MKKSFYKDLELITEGNVYAPREDSLLFADNLHVQKGEKVLEIGTGSGLLSIIAAKQGAEVTAVDINPNAIICAKANARSAKVHINFLEGDMFEPVEEKFDLIIFNPPYLPGKRELEGDEALVNAGTIEKFLEQYKNHLNENGKVLLIVSSLTDLEIEAEVMATKKLSFEELKLLELK